MTDIIFLGTSKAIPNSDHQNSHLVVRSGERVILVDCGVNPLVRLRQVGIDPLSLTDLFVTHFHPDHVSGLPLFLMNLWLLGRKKTLDIYALDVVVDRLKMLMDLFDWEGWDGFYPVNFHCLPDEEMMPCIESGDIQVWASASCHSVPSIGIRMDFPEGSLCYSSDTASCEAIKRLAEGVDLLIHEAADEDGHGHSKPEQAGEIASSAEVEALFLIHYDPESDLDALKKRAEQTFGGKVIIAQDLMTVNFS
jgi:ribonuclease Z